MNIEDQKNYCINWALEKVKAENKESFRSSLEVIISHARKSHHSMELYYKKLHDLNDEAADGEKPALLLEQLREWIPDLSLTPGNVVTFVNDCLDKYYRELDGLKKLEKESGHYKPEYTEAQGEASDRYEATLKIITSFRKELEIWWFEVSPMLREELSRQSSTQNKYSKVLGNTCVLKQIRQHTIEYLKSRSSNTKEPYIAINELYEVLLQIAKKTLLFPFLYFVYCIIWGIPLFRRENIDSDPMPYFEANVYKTKPAIHKQRLSRLSFLCKLCNTLCVNGYDVEENLLCFIMYHGLVIDSPEEAELWETVLNQYNLMDSPVSLGYRYYSLKKQCIPFKPERIMCLESCSALDCGGLGSFMRKFPDYKGALYNITKPVKNQIPVQPKMDYLKEWTFVPSDKNTEDDENTKTYQQARDIAREICSELSKKFKWKDPEAIQKWFDEWDHEEVSYPNHFTRRSIDENELKCILIECIIQDELNREAQDKLYKLLLEALDKKLRKPQ